MNEKVSTDSMERDLASIAREHIKPSRAAEAIAALSAPYGIPKGYEELDRILRLAFDQSAKGKGKERHALSPIGQLPWELQPILANARQVGPGGPAQQVMKKAGESVTMAGNRNLAGAKAEALGAIVYAAALYKLYEEIEAAGLHR
jgi:hypothetical protein